MTEDNHTHSVSLHPVREQDCNSNCTGPPDTVTASRLSNVSSNDGDVHDTSDYQWFADFGYKHEQNGGTAVANTDNRPHHPTSIFQILASPNFHGDFTYEDLSRNIDANLAEIDMEDFRSEDINSILALPAMYCGDFRSQNHGEQAASLSHSIMAKFDGFESSSVSHHSTSGESTDMSVCQNEPLFSPMKDNLAFPTFSVDSLDCDSYNEGELMLTCQANMNNYTIAFEGSFTKYSDDSDYHEAAGSETTDSNSWSGQFKLRSSDSIDSSLVQSDFTYTTWSKLKRGSETVQRRVAPVTQSPTCKSQSLPNLFRKSSAMSDIKISQLNVSTDSDQCVPVYDVQSSQSTHYSRSSDSSSQQSLSLMRLFMQQKAGGSSGASSVSHSLSSGTLQQMQDLYGADHFTSADERLHYVLNSNLHGSDSSNDSGNGALAEAADPSRQRNFSDKSCNVHDPNRSPIHLMHHHKSCSDATKNLLKRRLKSQGLTATLKSSSGSCKLYGGEAMHDDGTGRANSPLASPIEEEDENEDLSQWSTSTLPDDRELDVSRGHRDNLLMEWAMRKDIVSKEELALRNNAVELNANRPSKVRLINNFKPTCKSNKESTEGSAGYATKPCQGTQTKCVNGSPFDSDVPINARMSSMEAVSKRRSGGQGDAVSSSSSGYTSARSNSADQNDRCRLLPCKDVLAGGARLNVSIASYNSRSTQIPVHVHDEAVQTSFKSEWIKRILAEGGSLRGTVGAERMGCSMNTDERPEGRGALEDSVADKKAIYVCYPNYSLPDLSFLRNPEAKGDELSKMLLVPAKSLTKPCMVHKQTVRPHSCTSLEMLRHVDLSRIQDWDSLSVLLPKEVRDMLTEIRSKSTDSKESQRSEDATSLSDRQKPEATSLDVDVADGSMTCGRRQGELDDVGKYDVLNGDTVGTTIPRGQRPPPPPPPKRSISLPQGDSGAKGLSPEPYVSSKPPLPKGILRRSNLAGGRVKHGLKRYSMSDFLAMQQQQEKLLNRHQLPQTVPCDCLNFTLTQELEPVTECPLTAELAGMLGLSLKTCTCRVATAVDGMISCPIAAKAPTGGPLPMMSCCPQCLSPNATVSTRTVSVVPQPCPRCYSNKTTKEVDDGGTSKSSGTASGGSHQECSHGEDCQCTSEVKNKKTVSFSSNVHVENNLLKKDGVHNEEDGSSMMASCCCLHSPKERSVKEDDAGKEWPSLTSEDAPQEFCVSPIKENFGEGGAPTTEADARHFLKWQRKRDLVIAVNEAVKALDVYFGQAKDPHHKFIMGSCLQTPTTGHKVFHHLCPALFAILSDGLQPEIYNPFGRVDNSVWMVIEATAQSGNCTKQMSDLVIHVNNEQALWEKRKKFNAFVFGLLNIRSLDTWFSLLGTCGGILQKHYSPDAFLQLVKTTLKSLFDELLLSLQTLSLLPFDLDLLLEIHLLKNSSVHCDYHDCLPPQLHHGDHLMVTPLCCFTTTTATLSKSTPGIQCRCDKSKFLVHRHSCGHFGNYEICCAQQQTLSSDAALDSLGINKDRRLRRGYSQDSAIATGSSDCSNGSNSAAMANTSCDADATLTKRPRSYVDCEAVWTDAELMAEAQKRWSCGKLILENLDCGPNRDSKDAVVPLQDAVAASKNRNKVDDGFQEVPVLEQKAPGEDSEMKEHRDHVKQPMVIEAGSKEIAKMGCKDSLEDFKQDAEKGSLDATIVERWSAPRDSQNNINRTKEEVYNPDKDSDKTDNDEDVGKDQGRFKELQMRWEILSCATSEKKRSTNSNVRSKIPRLITPPKLNGKMEDSSRTSLASGTSSPESNNSRSVASVTIDGENAKLEVGAESKKLRLPPESSCNLNRNTSKVGANIKVLGGQPAIVIKTSGDKSPLRKRASPKKMPPSSAAMPTRFKQIVSRGVGGEGQSEN